MQIQMKKEVSWDVVIFALGVFAIFCFGVAVLPYMHPEISPFP